MPSICPENQSSSSLPSENKVQTHASINKDIDQNSTIVESNVADVRLSINALLDAIDTLKSISEVRTNVSLPTNESRPAQPQFAERRTTIKQPRKSRLQHRIVTSQPKPLPINNLTLPSFEQHLNEQSLSPTPLTIPLRPLSISPARYISIFIDLFFYFLNLSSL
jgi:hypothetical protein